MDLRTPLLVTSLIACVGLGAWALSLKGEVETLSEQVATLEAARQAAAERGAERRRGGPRAGQSGRSGPQRPSAMGAGGPGGRGVIEGRGVERVAQDSGGEREALLQEAEDNVRAEIAAERRARHAERGEEMQAALQLYLDEAGYAEDVVAEINALFDANRADVDALFAEVEAGELDRREARREMRDIREDTHASLEELLGEEEAENLEHEVFRGGRRPGELSAKE